MRVAIRAARDQNAQSRILTSIQKLAELIGMSLHQDLLKRLQVQKGDVATRATLEREAIADLLELMVDHVEIQKALYEQYEQSLKEPPAPPEAEMAPEPEPAVIAEAPVKKPRGRKAK
jgi:hypothetical protein